MADAQIAFALLVTLAFIFFTVNLIEADFCKTQAEAIKKNINLGIEQIEPGAPIEIVDSTPANYQQCGKLLWINTLIIVPALIVLGIIAVSHIPLIGRG